MTGRTVRLNKKSLTEGQTEVHLNKHQLKRLARIEKTQKGGTLSFTEPQIRSLQKAQGKMVIKVKPEPEVIDLTADSPVPATVVKCSDSTDLGDSSGDETFLLG